MPALERLLRDLTLVTLALAIALGWSLFRFASGVSQMISTLLVDFPESEGSVHVFQLSEPLTWAIGDRVVTLGALLRGTVELVVVVLVALLVCRRTNAQDVAARADDDLDHIADDNLDRLTGLLNSRAFYEALEQEITRAEEQDQNGRAQSQRSCF